MSKMCLGKNLETELPSLKNEKSKPASARNPPKRCVSIYVLSVLVVLEANALNSIIATLYLMSGKASLLWMDSASLLIVSSGRPSSEISSSTDGCIDWNDVRNENNSVDKKEYRKNEDRDPATGTLLVPSRTVRGDMERSLSRNGGEFTEEEARWGIDFLSVVLGLFGNW